MTRLTWIALLFGIEIASIGLFVFGVAVLAALATGK